MKETRYDPLRELAGNRNNFVAVLTGRSFRRTRSGKYKVTLLFSHCRLRYGSPDCILSHFWLDCSPVWEKALEQGLVIGSLVGFSAVVQAILLGEFRPGQIAYEARLDFKMTRPANVELLGKMELEEGEAYVQELPACV